MAARQPNPTRSGWPCGYCAVPKPCWSLCSGPEPAGCVGGSRTPLGLNPTLTGTLQSKPPLPLVYPGFGCPLPAPFPSSVSASSSPTSAATNPGLTLAFPRRGHPGMPRSTEAPRSQRGWCWACLRAGDPGMHRSTTSPGGTWVLLSSPGQQEMCPGAQRATMGMSHCCTSWKGNALSQDEQEGVISSPVHCPGRRVISQGFE